MNTPKATIEAPYQNTDERGDEYDDLNPRPPIEHALFRVIIWKTETRDDGSTYETIADVAESEGTRALKSDISNAVSLLRRWAKARGVSLPSRSFRDAYAEAGRIPA